MKKVALAAAMALALGGTAKADMFDYGQIIGGGTMEPTLTTSDPLFGVNDNDMSTGFNVGGALGWNLGPDLSLEIEGFYTHSAYDSPLVSSGSLETMSFMGNIFWNFDCGGKWKPFIGAGLGGAQVTITDGVYGGVPFTGDSDIVFAWQAMAGVTIPVAETVDLLIEYRFQSAEDTTLDITNGVGVTLPVTQEYQSHNLSAGFRLHF